MAGRKDEARGGEGAAVHDLSTTAGVQARIAELTALRDRMLPEGMDATRLGVRMEDHEHGNAPKMPDPPKGAGAGRWEPTQVADDADAHYAHERVWVEHHGLDNGRWMDGQLMKWVEGER